MTKEKYNPRFYEEEKVKIYFEIGGKENFSEEKFLEKNINLNIEIIEEKKDGFLVELYYQEIPEIVRNLSKENIAIYRVELK